MYKQDFQDFFAQKGFKLFGNMAFGVESGYPLSVELLQSGLVIAKFGVEIEFPKETNKKWKKQFKTKGRIGCAADVVTVTIPFRRNRFAQGYEEMISKIMPLFQEDHIRPLSKCTICGQGDCDSLVAIGSYTPIHKRCLDHMAENQVQKAELSEKNGNYFTGLIGAILGMLVGIIPTLLTVIFNDTIYAVLFAIIPLCIYQGYKLCKGKMNRVVIVISIILSIISVYMMTILLAAYQLVAMNGIPLGMAFTALAEVLVSLDIWIEITVESYMYFIFVAIGIYIAWNKISRTKDTEIKDVENLKGTVARHPAYLGTEYEPGQ